MKAAIYCRVSTEDQEREGTSLETQAEACLAKARELGCEVPEEYVFSETWTGADMGRPGLSKLREMVRQQLLDCVICLATDRLARNPIHIAIIAEECEKRGIELVFVSEPLDNSPEGQLIRYVKGYAAEIERVKIAERTMRGRKARALSGKLPTGGLNLYGYVYDAETGKRRVNDYEAGVIRQMFKWLAEDKISCNEVCRRLMANNIPAPKGGTRWGRTTVGRILRNPVYYGQTFANKMVSVEAKNSAATRRYKKNRRELRSEHEWIALPDATPPIISKELYDSVQERLEMNRELAPRQQKHQYLLRGLVWCKQCGRRYHGEPERHYRYYRCSGRNKLVSPVPCRNRRHKADFLEESVWAEVKAVLLDPDLLIAELKSMRDSNAQVEHLEGEIRLNQQRLTTLEEAETRVSRLYAYAGGDIEKAGRELRRINAERERAIAENIELEKRIEGAKKLRFDENKIRYFCNLAQQNIENLTFEQKRLALEELKVKVWVDDKNVAIEGAIPDLDFEQLAQHS